jgi:hypothetical protein
LHLAAAMSLVGFYAMADEPGRSCRTSPNLVGACFTVHGRLFVAIGTPSVRILPVGTNRILGVLDRQVQAESDEIIPAAVKVLLTSSPFFVDVYGDYEVCPFEKDATGSMRAVCVESASHLVARHRQGLISVHRW